MTLRALPFRIVARAALVFAALLQLAGAAGGPWAHTHGLRAASGPQMCAVDHQGAHHGAVAHDELWCGVWEALGSTAPPASGVALASGPFSGADTDAVPVVQDPAYPPLSPPARAPPLG